MATIVNNPNTLGVAGVTLDEFIYGNWRVELRRAKKGNTVYHWVRTTRRFNWDPETYWSPRPHLVLGGITVGEGTGFSENPPGKVMWSKALGLPNTSWAGTYGQYDPMHQFTDLYRKPITTKPM